MEDEKISIFLDADGIASTVQAVARRMNSEFNSESATLVCVLQGAFIFFADLIRLLDFPFDIDFIHAESYRSETHGGAPELRSDCAADIAGRRILLVEDIVDSGRTARFLSDHLLSRGASSCEVCALLDKPSRRETSVDIAYCGLTVPDRFFVGYGMDLGGRYRNLPGLYTLEPGFS